MVRAVDGSDLRQSKALSVMALEPGQVRLATQRPWKALRAEVGEVAGGQWRTWEQLPVQVKGEEVSFPVDEDRARAILVLAEANELPTATRRLAQQVRWVPE